MYGHHPDNDSEAQHLKQSKFWIVHSGAISSDGPCLYRMCHTLLQGWQRYKDYPDPHAGTLIGSALDPNHT